METELAAAGFNLVLKDVLIVENIKYDIAASPWVNDLSDIDILSILNTVNSDFRSVEAKERTFARSVDQEEWFIIKFFRIIMKLDFHDERSTVSRHALLFATAGFFLG